MSNICHISTLHPRFDTRVFHRELVSLAKKFNTYFIVADGKGDEIINSVKIIDLGLRNSSRIKRARIDSKKAFRKAVELNCEIYHLHDPELISIGFKLKKAGKKVIFDSHEYFPEKIKARTWIPALIRPLVAKAFRFQYQKAAKKFDGIIAASPHIAEQTKSDNTILLRNYPSKNLIESLSNRTFTKKQNQILYTGGLTEFRGIEQLVKALIKYGTFDWNLVIVGTEHKVVSENLKEELKDKRIDFRGRVEYDEVVKLMNESSVGVVLNQEIHDYQNSLPNKLFEYMAAGLPILCSDFPHWNKLMKETNAGLSCKSDDLKAISENIKTLLSNKIQSEKMSIGGKKAVEEYLNWETEAESLFEFYNKLIG